MVSGREGGSLGEAATGLAGAETAQGPVVLDSEDMESHAPEGWLS